LVLNVEVQANDPYELSETGQSTLSASNPWQSFEMLMSGNPDVIAFDYWYTPDPVFKVTHPDWFVVTQTYGISGPGDQLGAHPELVVYRPSTEWSTCVVNSCGGLLNIGMTQYKLYGPPHSYWDMTNGCTIAPEVLQQLPDDYIVNNQLSVRNFRFYDSYSDYLADVRGSNNWHDGHDGHGGGWNDGDGGGHCGSDQPVPEPGTWAMMGMGALSLLGFEIRKRRAQQ
jgi:hypothetical protein